MRKLTTGTAAFALTAALGLGTAGAATAATTATAGTTTPASVSAQDVMWMKSNAHTDLAEIAIGKLAMAKSHNADLLKVAKVTMENHEAALAKLKSVAKEEGVKLPGQPNAEQRKAAAVLETFSGRKFNLNWDEVQILGHKLSISQTKTEISAGTAKPVVNFAKYYLPIARMHLAMAEKLHQELT